MWVAASCCWLTVCTKQLQDNFWCVFEVMSIDYGEKDICMRSTNLLFLSLISSKFTLEIACKLPVLQTCGTDNSRLCWYSFRFLQDEEPLCTIINARALSSVLGSQRSHGCGVMVVKAPSIKGSRCRSEAQRRCSRPCPLPHPTTRKQAETHDALLSTLTENIPLSICFLPSPICILFYFHSLMFIFAGARAKESPWILSLCEAWLPFTHWPA